MVRELLAEAGLTDVTEVDAGRNAFGRWTTVRAVRPG
jgi:hypothetical protein